MTSLVQLFHDMQDFFAAITQELLVLVVFFLSLALWRYIGKRHKPLKAQKVLFSSFDDSAPLHKVKPKELPVDAKVLQSIQAAESQMMKLLEQREFTRALNYFRSFERDGNDRHFSEALLSAFIQSAIRVGKLDVVERIIRGMRKRGFEPSHEFWRTTLKMLSSRKHFDTCLTLYTVFGSSLPADKVVFSCLINGALESGAPDRAAAMLPRYQQADLNARDHVLLFRTYVAVNDLPSAEAVFRNLGESMTSLMLNLLLLTAVNLKDPDRALALLHEACAFQDNRDNRVENADIERIVDVVSYNTVIKGFTQVGKLTQCFECLDEMKSCGLEPDDVTFGTLLDTCIADGRANEVVTLLMNSDRPMDTVMCTLFIKGLVRAHRLPQAMGLYEEMKRRKFEGAKPDIVTYSVLIKAFVDNHELEKALHLVEDMTAAGHAADDIILTHLLEGCRYVGNHALGKRLFEDMLAAGVKPSEFTLITMVKLHGRCGAHEEAYELVSNWEKRHGVKPSVIHYTCLMSGCLRTKNYDQAWQAYTMMSNQGVPPDETTMATLLPGMVAAQHWERVLNLVRRALKAPHRINIATETLNSALFQMRQSAGQNLYADQLQKIMQDTGVPINSRNSRR